MQADHDLTEAYQEWRYLAETEGEAIQSGNWSLVSASQKALQHLQERISRLLPAVRAEWSKPGGDRTAKELNLNTTIRDLIKLEQRNRALLGTRLEAARAKLDQLSQVSRNLKQLQRSYGPAPLAAWTSFS